MAETCCQSEDFAEANSHTQKMCAVTFLSAEMRCERAKNRDRNKHEAPQKRKSHGKSRQSALSSMLVKDCRLYIVCSRKMHPLCTLYNFAMTTSSVPGTIGVH